MSTDEQEKVNAATDSGASVVVSADSSLLGLCAAIRQVIDTPIDRLPLPAVVAAAETLARGLVLCCLLVIVLSWFYPDRINAAVGVVTPIITVMLHLRQKAEEKKNV